jgi:selenocysteine lyase/cysteine desulfurase
VNTNSENNACALQITKFREGARSIIKKCVNATDDDVLIFTGKGKIFDRLNKIINLFVQDHPQLLVHLLIYSI